MHTSKQANNNCEQAKLHNSCTIQSRVPYSENDGIRVNANSARKRSNLRFTTIHVLELLL